MIPQLNDGFMFSAVKCINPGIAEWRKEAIALRTPTSPAVISVWPMHDLAAPTMSGVSECECWKTWLMPWISIRSPRDVPRV
jgi:hypothetical protein